MDLLLNIYIFFFGYIHLDKFTELELKERDVREKYRLQAKYLVKARNLAYYAIKWLVIFLVAVLTNSFFIKTNKDMFNLINILLVGNFSFLFGYSFYYFVLFNHANKRTK